MNDPHVASLSYRLRVGPEVKFNNTSALEREYDSFHLRLADGILVATMKVHFTSADDARTEVEPFLRAWEIDSGLKHAPSTISFSLSEAEIIDRNPTSPGMLPQQVTISVSGIAIGGCVTTIYQLPSFPLPPSRFKASEEVGLMWYRFCQYTEGKEPLLSMAYAVLTLLEGTTGLKEGSRNAVCVKYGIDQPVRKKLGDLVSQKGTPNEARKLDHGATWLPLTDADKNWVVAVVKALIRRKAEHDADPLASLSLLTLSDFPPI